MCKHIHHCGIICSSESVTRGEMKQSAVLNESCYPEVTEVIAYSYH